MYIVLHKPFYHCKLKRYFESVQRLMRVRRQYLSIIIFSQELLVGIELLFLCWIWYGPFTEPRPIAESNSYETTNQALLTCVLFSSSVKLCICFLKKKKI